MGKVAKLVGGVAVLAAMAVSAPAMSATVGAQLRDQPIKPWHRDQPIKPWHRDQPIKPW